MRGCRASEGRQTGAPLPRGRHGLPAPPPAPRRSRVAASAAALSLLLGLAIAVLARAVGAQVAPGRPAGLIASKLAVERSSNMSAIAQTLHGNVPLLIPLEPDPAATATRRAAVAPNAIASKLPQRTTTRRGGVVRIANGRRCSVNSQCFSRCCTRQRSTDGLLRCQPVAACAVKKTTTRKAVRKTTKRVRITTKRVRITTQRPAAAVKPEWEQCEASTECASGCCSVQWSNDGVFKCHPVGSTGCVARVTRPTTTKQTGSAPTSDLLDLWIPCYAASDCQSNCCSVVYSSDGIWKCHHSAVCAIPTTNTPPAVPTRTAKSVGGTAEFGVHVSWGNEPGVVQEADGSLAAIAARIGRTPSFVGDFFSFGTSDVPNGLGTQWIVDHATLTRPVPNGFLITLMPWDGLASITDAHLAELQRAIRLVFAAGVRIVQVRFAPEMNGNWYPAWSMQPERYRATFIRVAKAVQAAGALSVWAPNVLDCWRSSDDPYGPYFPAEDPSSVDIVGLSFYHIDNTYNGTNDVPPPDKLVRTLTGWNLRTRIHWPNCDYVGRFADRYSKPFHLTETGAIYRPGRGGASELDIKRAWWRQLYNGTAIDLLGMGFVGWFEFFKFEYGEWRDFRFTSPGMLRSFIADLPFDRFLFTA
ncbi:glycoside hydrolase superfamily [Hyaloraphidium curvatum]|nr:glycoside hydrolase superfamily [Hyaloraphidium curvatum]